MVNLQELLLRLHRRAKLKRLTVPDRERMMKSRALPEDFDRSTALHSAFSRTPQPKNNTTLSPSCGSDEPIRAFTGVVGFGHRRDLSGETSSSSIPSVYSEPLWTPSSAPGSQTNSPIIPVDESIHNLGSLASHVHTPHQDTIYARSRSFPSIYGTPLHPPSHMRDELSASPPAAFTHTGHTGRRSSEMLMVFGRPVRPGLLDFPEQSQREPHFHGMISYSPPRRDSSPTQSQPDLPAEHQIQRAQPTTYQPSFHTGPTYPTLGDPRPQHPPPMGFPIFQPHSPMHQIQISPSFTPSGYSWSPSAEQNTRLSSGVPYPASYSGQVSYGAIEGATEDTIDPEERPNLVFTPVIGLGLPQQVFTTSQGPQNSSERPQNGDR